ncbi:hypothetical protein ACIA58_20820 [Kribbella sp. NPDC051586]|uniref:hypothetical protein n=1 Tax=Kribbella sp. NPDC051586 TaxID=3364118 RepID=UPI00379BB6A1
MKRVAVLVVATTMSAGLLTACSRGGDYCQELKSYGDLVKNLDIKDSQALDKIANGSNKLSKSAPDDVKDDWKTVRDFANKVKGANGNQEKVAEADAAKVDAAWKAIAANAKDKCKFDLENM